MAVETKKVGLRQEVRANTQIGQQNHEAILALNKTMKALDGSANELCEQQAVGIESLSKRIDG